MKQLLLIITILLSPYFLSAQSVSIPDANFENYLETHDSIGNEVVIGHLTSMGDGVINNLTLKSKVVAVDSLNVSNKGIIDLSGIEAFTSLTYLICDRNELDRLDVSSNTSLTYLDCNRNELDSLDVSSNTSLTYLDCNRNELDRLDISNNTSLTYLDCETNQLESLDVSSNTSLTYLKCDSNPITSLNVSNNTKLDVLRCQNNSLRSIDISSNTSLTILSCGGNPLGSLDISNNTNLTTLSCHSNQLSSIDVSNNTNLISFNCLNNSLTELNVNNNTSLRNLSCHENALTSLDVSNNTNLTSLNCRSNPLTSIDVSNINTLKGLTCSDTQLTSIDLSNNIALTKLLAENNPYLTSVDLRNGNNKNIVPAFPWQKLSRLFNLDNTPNLTCVNADANYNPLIDSEPPAEISEAMAISGKTFSEECGDFVTSIPDPIFEQTLITLGIDTNGATGDILNGDARAVTSLRIEGKGINDLAGIEAFTNLTEFRAGSNPFTSINLLNNTKLEHLRLLDSQLSSIDLSGNSLLQKLYIGGSLYSTIDVSQNSNLEWLIFENSQVSTINVSSNLNLTKLYVDNNPLLTNIDVSKNHLLNAFSMSYNTPIKALDLSNNPIVKLYIEENTHLISLDVRNGNNVNTTRFSLYNSPNISCVNADPIVSDAMTAEADYMGFTFSVDCGDFVHIPDPNFEQALIDELIDSDGVINSSILTEDAVSETGPLSVFSKNISDLTGIEAFINITSLTAFDNNLDSLDVSSNTKLTSLNISKNKIAQIDLSSNTLLEGIRINSNRLKQIDLSANTNLTSFVVSYNELTLLDVSANTSLTELSATNNQLPQIDLSFNPEIVYLRLEDNLLSQLDISTLPVIDFVGASGNMGIKLITDATLGSPTLTALYLNDTGLSNFDLSPFPNIERIKMNNNSLKRLNTSGSPMLNYLQINNNQLTSLDLSLNPLLERLFASDNLLTDLNVKNGSNSILTKLDVENNLLTCITADSDDQTAIPYNSWTTDGGVMLSLDCGGEPEVILIPDANFEATLISLGYDNNNELDEVNGSILVSEAEAITTLIANNASISSLTGIESMINLLSLDVSGNSLDSINLLENTNLTNVNVSGNLLTELFINSGRDLVSLNCSNNQLAALNFADLTDLETFDGSNNSFQSLDASSHDLLTSFNVSSNSLLTELDMRNGNNGAITSFDATDNPSLACIGVDDESNMPLPNWLANADYTNSGDCSPPTVFTQNITIELDRDGLASIARSDIDGGTTDNSTASGKLIFDLSQTEFDCTNLGENTVELTAADEFGNTSDPVTAQVTVVDIIAPSAKSLRTYTYDLEGAAGYTLENVSLINDGSTDNDNCDSLTFSVDQDYFSSPGTYPVLFTATDASGNSATDNTTIEIIDSDMSGEELKFGGLSLTVYPVPFSNVINISFSKPTNLNTVDVKLLDSNGNPTIPDINFSPNGQGLISDNINDLPSPSTYILQVTIGSKTKTIQIIKTP